ncbi:hypothetical protein CRENBAI_019539 [Crenichthys baileyi]|uniref:Uncharacterized protein n=1 Tax=Crenichthys baileyi TaxID=28760 RepID=A0AAV9R1E3_9TELE
MTPSCVSAPTNQRQVCIPPQPITVQGFAFKDLHPWISLLSRRTSILLLSINEIVLPATRLPPPHHPAVSVSSFSSERSSGTPGFHILYSASLGVRLQLCHVSTSSSPLCRRSTCSLAPPTDIHPRNARPGSSLKQSANSSSANSSCWLPAPVSSRTGTVSPFFTATSFSRLTRFSFYGL